MWFRVAVEWKYALYWFRSHSTSDNVMKWHLSSLSGSGVRSSGLKLRKSQAQAEVWGVSIFITRSHCLPCWMSVLLRWWQRWESALPKDHDVTISNFFSRTTPWFGILTGNSTDADLSLPSAEMNRCCGDEHTTGRRAPQIKMRENDNISPTFAEMFS
jgi:hypothetical protein